MTSDGTAAGLLPGLRSRLDRVSRRAIRYWTARAAVNGLAIVAAEIAVTIGSAWPPPGGPPWR